MKKIVVLLCSVVLFNCGGDADSPDDGADPTDDDTDSADVIADDDAGEDTEDPDAPCIDCDVNMLDEGGDADVNMDEVDVGSEVTDIPAEYLFIVGTWKQVECDGSPCADEVQRDIMIESWDDIFGAKILGMDPFYSIYLKKNPNNGQFEFGNPEGPFGLTSGTADHILLKIFITQYLIDNPS